MKRLQIKDADIMAIALQQEIKRSEESRYDHRLHGVLLICQRHDCHQVGRWLGESPTTIQRWVHRFEEHGLAGLQDGTRSGRPHRLDAKIWSKVEKDLRQSPRTWDYQQNLWDGKLLAHHLINAYSVQMGVRQCQRLFKQMGFRRRKPRPVIAQADPEAQAAFKKTPQTGDRSGTGSVERG